MEGSIDPFVPQQPPPDDPYVTRDTYLKSRATSSSFLPEALTPASLQRLWISRYVMPSSSAAVVGAMVLWIGWGGSINDGRRTP